MSHSSRKNKPKKPKKVKHPSIKPPVWKKYRATMVTCDWKQTLTLKDLRAAAKIIFPGEPMKAYFTEFEQDMVDSNVYFITSWDPMADDELGHDPEDDPQDACLDLIFGATDLLLEGAMIQGHTPDELLEDARRLFEEVAQEMEQKGREHKEIEEITRKVKEIFPEAVITFPAGIMTIDTGAQFPNHKS